MAAIFIMDFLFIYYDAIDNILYVDDYAIKTFLGNWYIRKSMTPRVAEINRFLTAIADFYTFLYKKGILIMTIYVTLKRLARIKSGLPNG